MSADSEPTYYKITKPDGTPCFGGTRPYGLPKLSEDGSWTPGEWRPRISPKVLKTGGYSVINGTSRNLLSSISRVVTKEVIIWEVETAGERYPSVLEEENGKALFETVRLIKPVLMSYELPMYMCDCVERVLHVYERIYPGKSAPREAIRIARFYMRGLASDAEMKAAASAVWTVVLAEDAALKAREKKILRLDDDFFDDLEASLSFFGSTLRASTVSEADSPSGKVGGEVKQSLIPVTNIEIDSVQARQALNIAWAAAQAVSGLASTKPSSPLFRYGHAVLVAGEAKEVARQEDYKIRLPKGVRAGAAEETWQNERLRWYIEGGLTTQD